MSAFAVERVGAAGLDLLVVLHAACLPAAWDRDALARLLAMPGCEALIAGDGSGAATARPVGLALYRVAGGEGEIPILGVLPAARRAGAGRALLGACLRRMGQAGATRFFLEVAEDNAPAIALYRAFGFVALGRRAGYYGRSDGGPLDALVLGLEADAAAARLARRKGLGTRVMPSSSSSPRSLRRPLSPVPRVDSVTGDPARSAALPPSALQSAGNPPYVHGLAPIARLVQNLAALD